MKIAILSDSHDNIVNIHKALDFLKKEGIKTMIHCGDVCAPSTLKELSKKFDGKINIIFGNVDGDHFRSTRLADTKLKNVLLYGELGEIELDGKKIAFTHLPKFARGLAMTGDYDIVFYGHSHKPWEETINLPNNPSTRLRAGKKVQLANPGTLAGMFYKATFAIYDTKSGKLELKILEQIN